MAPELEIDFDSDAWRVIEVHAQKQLNELRLSNDKPSLDAIATAGIRGRIAAWKELLELPSKRLKAEEVATRQPSFSGY